MEDSLECGDIGQIIKKVGLNILKECKVEFKIKLNQKDANFEGKCWKSIKDVKRLLLCKCALNTADQCSMKC